MEFIEDTQEATRSDWLELANGGGIMLRDLRQLKSPQPAPYKRWRKQLSDARDSVEPSARSAV